jgi:starch synthase (maltosyl-transferring)
MSALAQIIERLEARRATTYPRDTRYYVPGLWVDINGDSVEAVRVNPFDFYHERLVEIADAEPQPLVQIPHSSGGGEWTQQAIIYNMFPRVTAAFDHNRDGKLDIGDEGWRETGTLLKSIALLPYIQGMGFNTVHLLPITSIGQDGKKGTLGSPYAIRNPYQIDEHLAEPVLDLSADVLFAGFVEAAHRLGVRVVLEFVLRTASKDSDWIPHHPDWFYWIRADIPDRTGRGTGRLGAFGNPVFPHDMLSLLKSKVADGDFRSLPPPSAVYQGMFTDPPRPDQVYMENGRYFAVLDNGTRVRVPGAFADWPPDDPQPPWTDVTYLRMYDHPEFNYVAYNTLRMYDDVLARPEHCNGPLWDAVAGVIPHYQQHFGIDGVMLDMGHALPLPLKERMVASARAINPDFAFWEEDFTINQRSRDEGYNAVMGWWPLAAHQGESMRNMLTQMAHGPLPIACFAAPENHNTPRAASRHGGRAYSHYALALASMTSALPFILSGFELCETQPINTGVGFSPEQLVHYPSEKLPLFSEYAFNWTRADHMVRSVKYALSIRKKYESLLCDHRPSSLVIGYSSNPAILVFSRRSGKQWVSVIANTDPTQEQRGRVVVDTRAYRVPGLWGTSPEGMDVYRELVSEQSLVPGYVVIFDGSSLPIYGGFSDPPVSPDAETY